MAIHSIQSGSAVNTPTQVKPASKNTLESKTQPVSLAKDDDTVKITHIAQEINKAAETSNTEPVVNEKRVAEIKAALEAGNYTIDPERVADKMLQLETQLTNST